MKPRFLPLLCVALLSGCLDDITVHIAQDPGSISGIVFPVEAQAAVRLYQDELIAETTTNDTGRFRFDDVDPGNYILWISADGYGSKKIDNIEMEAGAGRFLGEIQLLTMPWPLSGFSPGPGKQDYNPGRDSRIGIYFSESITASSIESSITISPPVEDLAFEYFDYQRPPHKMIARIISDFALGTAYSIVFDTTLVTKAGRRLEFPYTYSITTIPFQITAIQLAYSGNQRDRYGNNDIIIRLNGSVSTEGVSEHLAITPDIPVFVSTGSASYGGSAIRITPELAWQAGATSSITIKSTLSTIRGTTLERDSTFTFYMDSLDVLSTRPYDGQLIIPTDTYLTVDFNTLIDESTLTAAVGLSPFQELEFVTSRSGTRSYVRIFPDTLLAATAYSVTIDTSLKDYWGGPLVAPYSFTFITQ